MALFFRVDGIDPEEIDDDTARELANRLFVDLEEEFAVDVDGVIPVLNEEAEPRLRPIEDDAVPTWGAVKTLAEHMVETHTTIDERIEDLERRMDRAERDIDLVDGGF